jgi:hypothetical protein
VTRASSFAEFAADVAVGTGTGAAAAAVPDCHLANGTLHFPVRHIALEDLGALETDTGAGVGDGGLAEVVAGEGSLRGLADAASLEVSAVPEGLWVPGADLTFVHEEVLTFWRDVSRRHFDNGLLRQNRPQSGGASRSDASTGKEMGKQTSEFEAVPWR